MNIIKSNWGKVSTWSVGYISLTLFFLGLSLTWAAMSQFGYMPINFDSKTKEFLFTQSSVFGFFVFAFVGAQQMKADMRYYQQDLIDELNVLDTEIRSLLEGLNRKELLKTEEGSHWFELLMGSMFEKCDRIIEFHDKEPVKTKQLSFVIQRVANNAAHALTHVLHVHGLPTDPDAPLVKEYVFVFDKMAAFEINRREIEFRDQK